MKKILSCVLALIIACGVLTGCGAKKDDSQPSTTAKPPQVYVKIHNTVNTSFSIEENGKETYINYVTKPVKWDNSNFDVKMDKDTITKNQIPDGSKLTMYFDKTTPAKIEVTKNKKAVDVKDNSFTIQQDKAEDLYQVKCTFKSGKNENTLIYAFIAYSNK